jgi:plastocyanin
MTATTFRPLSLSLLLLAVCCAPLTLATPVTVDVSSPSGTSPQDTVVVFSPLEATLAPAPAPTHESAVIDQVDKRFVPRVSVVRAGTEVSFPNSDSIRHQVYSFSPAKVFSLKLYAGTASAPVTFEKPGLVVLGCNIHDYMVGFVAVVDSPYFAKLPASGSATINLPPGRYRLRVWNPYLTAPIAAREVAVQSTPLAIALSASLDAAAPSVAAWPE